MEWIKNEWNLEAKVDEVVSSGMAEAEINIPADREGALRFLCCHARVENAAAETSQGQVSVEGTVSFTVLYETASGPDSMESRNGFSHTLTVPEAKSGQRVQIKVNALSTQVRWINERQCRVECVLQMQAAVYERQERNFVADLQGEDVQTMKSPVEGAWVTGSARRSFTLKEDVELDAALPAAEKVLLCQGQVEIESLSSQAGQINADGSLVLKVMYSAAAAQPIAHAVIPLRFSQQWDASELGQTQWLVGDGRLQECRVRIYENIRGERRVLAVEAGILLTVQGYAGQQSEVLVDSYSSGEKIELTGEKWRISGAPQQTQMALPVSGMLKLSEGTVLPETILQVLVNPVIDRVSIEEDRAILTGRLLTHVIHGSSEGLMGCITAAADFEAAAAAPGLKAGDWLQTEVVSTTPTAQAAQEGIQVRDTLEITLIWCSVMERDVVTEGTSEAWTDELPLGLSLVVVQPGEDTWGMAKRCRIPVSALVATNPQLEKRQARMGDCLVVERA